MKKSLLFFLILTLSACSIQTSEQLVTDEIPTETQMVVIDPTQNQILNSIRVSFSGGAHAGILLCEQCHSTRGGVVSGDLTWTDENSGRVENVSSSTQVCGKCHADQMKFKSTNTDHQLAHMNFDCTSCHDPHNLQASCAQSTCHIDIESTIHAKTQQPLNHTITGDPNSITCGASTCHALVEEVAKAPIYHQPVHGGVPCYVCHDSSGLTVTQTDDQSWITIQESGQSTGSINIPVISHRIGFEVDCSKCHSSNNAWNLIPFPPND